MKRVIFHADDFGLTPGVNRGIITAFKEGLITSASLIPSGEAFDDAVNLAGENPGLDLGIHLTLVEEKSVSPPQEIPSLVTRDGRFRKKYPIFLRDYLLRRIKMDDIEKEISAQFKKILDTGLPISHVDGHQQLHILPGILEIVTRLAKKENILGIRIPQESIRFRHLAVPSRWKRLFLQFGTNLVGAFSTRKIDLSCLRRAESCDGFFYSGCMTRENLIETLEHVNGHVTEIAFHPGVEDEELKTRYADWHYQWEAELRALTDPAVKNLAARQGIQRISYRDIVS